MQLEKDTTLAILKPDIIKDRQVGGVMSMIEQAGFMVQALELTQLTYQRAAQFYLVHQSRPFYQDLCTYMSSGPIVAICLAKEQAVPTFRALIGATNPLEAAEGTIRKRFGKSIDYNAVHGSDSDENAQIECRFFFPNYPGLTS